MTHQHAQGGTGTSLERKLLVTMLLNFLVTAVEAAGGIVSGAFPCLSDAMHNFSDGIAII